MKVTNSKLMVPSGALDNDIVLTGESVALVTEPLGTFNRGCGCVSCCGDVTDLNLGTVTSDHDDAGTPRRRLYTHMTWEEFETAGDTIDDGKYVAARDRVQSGGYCYCQIRVWFGKITGGGVGMASLFLSQGDLRIVSVDWDIPDIAGAATFFGLYQEHDTLTEEKSIDGGESCDLAGESMGDEDFGIAIQNTVPIYADPTLDPTTGVS